MTIHYQVFQIVQTTSIRMPPGGACGQVLIKRGDANDDPQTGIDSIKILTELEPNNSFTQIAVYSGK